MSPSGPANAISVNQIGFDRRMDVVRDIMRGFGFKDIEITPVAYDESYAYPFNNFIFKVVLPSPATTAAFRRAMVQGNQQHQPCTVLPPVEGVSTLIVRLSNPNGTGMNETNRVQNEVAAIHLARAAVSQLGEEYVDIVPAIYAWKAFSHFPSLDGDDDALRADEATFGWTIMDYKPGQPLDEQFRSFSLYEKKRVVGKIACVFAAIQSIKLPPGVESFGGLTIDDTTGAIISGQGVLSHSEPWPTYAAFFAYGMNKRLESIDTSVVLKGWRENGVRDRIDSLLTGEKLIDILEAAGIDPTQKSLLHFDFTMNNILWDNEAGRISALLDFDWSNVNHPVEELFISLTDVGGNMFNHASDKIKKAIISGDFDADDAGIEDEHREDWEIAKAWDTALRDAGGIRPSDIMGIRTLVGLRRLRNLLNPFHPNSGVSVKGKTPDELAEMRAEAEKSLIKALEGFGV